MPKAREILARPGVQTALWVGGTVLAVALTAAFIAPKIQARWKKQARAKLDCSKVGTTEGEVHGLRYIEHVTGGADPNAKLPMLIVFHSLGATPQGTANFKSLPPTRVIRPYGPYKTEKGGYRWLRTRKKDQFDVDMLETAEQLVPFVRDIQICRPTKGKPVVTGSSQGGHMTYLASSLGYPYVQGAVSVLGYLPEVLWSTLMAPTVGIHGTRDKTVNYARTKKYADTIGFPFYSFDAGHEITSAMSKKWYAEVKKMLGY